MIQYAYIPNLSHSFQKFMSLMADFTDLSTGSAIKCTCANMLVSSALSHQEVALTKSDISVKCYYDS